MINKELKNEAREVEILTADDEKLRRMLGGLKKVGAPKNFDFHLKARIANARPEDLRQSQPLLMPWLRYVLPLGLIVLFAGFAFFNLSLSAGNQPDVAKDSQPVRNETAAPEINVEPRTEPSLTATTNDESESPIKPNAPEIINIPKKPIQSDARLIAVKNQTNKRPEKFKKGVDDFVGSKDQTSKDDKIFTSRNANQNFGDPNPVNAAQAKIPLQEILARIGIEADFSGGGWKITSVKDKSLAILSDMRVGDLIEAIDDKKLTSDTVFEQAFTGKVFRIVRDGKQMLIELSVK